MERKKKMSLPLLLSSLSSLLSALSNLLLHILVESSLFPHLHLLYNPKVNFTKIVNAVAQFFATGIWGSNREGSSTLGRDPLRRRCRRSVV